MKARHGKKRAEEQEEIRRKLRHDGDGDSGKGNSDRKRERDMTCNEDKTTSVLFQLNNYIS